MLPWFQKPYFRFYGYDIYPIDPTQTDEKRLKINSTPSYAYGTIHFGEDVAKGGEKMICVLSAAFDQV